MVVVVGNLYPPKNCYVMQNPLDVSIICVFTSYNLLYLTEYSISAKPGNVQILKGVHAIYCKRTGDY